MNTKNKMFMILKLTLKITLKSTKYLEINLKDVQNCYSENYNTQLRKYKDYLSKYL